MPRTIAVEMMDELEGAKDAHCGACGCSVLAVFSSTELWCQGCGTIVSVQRNADGRPFLSWARSHESARYP